MMNVTKHRARCSKNLTKEIKSASHFFRKIDERHVALR